MSAKTRRIAVVVVALVLLGGLATLVLYARGGGPVPDALGALRPAGPDLLAVAGPEEVVLRTLRLAGYEHAAVGEQGGNVVVRVEVPATGSAADVALTWQTAMAAASAAYPEAERIAAQVFAADGQGLVEVLAPADAVAAAVRDGDPAALRKAATVRYITESEQ